MTLLTVFSDASHCHDTWVGTWAGWAKDSAGTYRGAGILNTRFTLTSDTELAAAINAVSLGIARAPGTSCLIIQSDNARVIQLIRGTSPVRRVSDNEKAMLAILLKKLDGRPAWAKHVKGHQGTKDRRSAVNTWCDKNCHRLLRDARDEHRINPKPMFNPMPIPKHWFQPQQALFQAAMQKLAPPKKPGLKSQYVGTTGHITKALLEAHLAAEHLPWEDPPYVPDQMEDGDQA